LVEVPPSLSIRTSGFHLSPLWVGGAFLCPTSPPRAACPSSHNQRPAFPSRGPWEACSPLSLFHAPPPERQTAETLSLLLCSFIRKWFCPSRFRDAEEEKLGRQCQQDPHLYPPSQLNSNWALFFFSEKVFDPEPETPPPQVNYDAQASCSLAHSLPFRKSRITFPTP